MGNCIFSSKKPKKEHKKQNECKKLKINSCNPLNKNIKKNIKIVNYHKKNIPKTLKKMVWDKYIGPDIGKTKCMCCKHQEIRQIEFHCGHIIAEVNGGNTSIDNLRPICAQCNLSMGKMNMDIFMKKYMANL